MFGFAILVLKIPITTKGYFQVPLFLKRDFVSLRAKPFFFLNKFDLHENELVGGTHFHMNGFALRLVLRQRQKALGHARYTYAGIL